jgi:large subunit ribosomal protein L21
MFSRVSISFHKFTLIPTIHNPGNLKNVMLISKKSSTSYFQKPDRKGSSFFSSNSFKTNFTFPRFSFFPLGNFLKERTTFFQQKFNFSSNPPLPDPLPPLTPQLNTKFSPVENSFAIIHVSGHQYKVTKGDLIMVEKLEVEVGKEIFLTKVLLVGTQDSTQIGTPLVSEAKVLAVVEEQTLADKVIIFKKKRRKNYQRHRGHRQPYTRLRIKGIYFDPNLPASATVHFTQREPIRLV